jgi:uncharacterized protein with PQ loop repeat
MIAQKFFSDFVVDQRYNKSMNLGAFHVVRDKTSKFSKKSLEVLPNLLFNKAAYAVGIIGTFFNIPQMLSIWVHRNATGVSTAAWIGFSITTLFWLSYAIYHKEKVLIVTFSLTLVFQIIIVIGSILF